MRMILNLLLWLFAALGLAAVIDMSGLYDVPMIDVECACMSEKDAE